MVRHRIRYQKVGAIRYTSHRDLLRMFRRSLASAGVPVDFSKGFNPHPRLSFGPSLRTGWEGLDEFMDLFLERPVEDLEARCNPVLPPGLEILACARVEECVPKLSADISAARYTVTIKSCALEPGRNPLWDSFIEQVGESDSLQDGARRIAIQALENDVRERFRPSANDERDAAQPSLIDIQISEEDGEIRIEYLSSMIQGKSLFPEMLEKYVGESLGLETPMHVVRRALYVERGGAYHSPISKGVVQNSL